MSLNRDQRNKLLDELRIDQPKRASDYAKLQNDLRNVFQRKNTDWSPNFWEWRPAFFVVVAVLVLIVAIAWANHRENVFLTECKAAGHDKFECIGYWRH